MLSSTTLTMFETCCTMDRWQQIGYFSYKAKLRQDINDDWIDINHDIWVSLFSFAQPFSRFSHVLFRKLVLKHHVLFVSRQHFYIDRLFSLPIVFCYPSFESFSPFSCCVAESRDVFFPSTLLRHLAVVSLSCAFPIFTARWIRAAYRSGSESRDLAHANDDSLLNS